MECCFLKLKNKKIRLQWDITELCNLNCIHCCAGKTVNIKKYPDEVIVSTVAAIKNFGFEKVSLSGGEPTLNESFPKIVKELEKNRIKIGLISNLYYDFSKIENLLDCFDSITTSVDGTRAIHNSIRGADCYDTTINNIKKIIEYGINIKVIYTLQKDNINCLEETVKNLSAIGVKSIMLAQISPRGRGITNSEKINLSLSSSDLQIHIDNLCRKYNIDIKNSKCSYLVSEKSSACLAGKYIFYLSPDLKLYPCHLRTNYGVSIFEEQSVEKIKQFIKTGKSVTNE